MLHRPWLASNRGSSRKYGRIAGFIVHAGIAAQSAFPPFSLSGPIAHDFQLEGTIAWSQAWAEVVATITAAASAAIFIVSPLHPLPILSAAPFIPLLCPMECYRMGCKQPFHADAVGARWTHAQHDMPCKQHIELARLGLPLEDRRLLRKPYGRGSLRTLSSSAEFRPPNSDSRAITERSSGNLAPRCLMTPQRRQAAQLYFAHQLRQRKSLARAVARKLQRLKP